MKNLILIISLMIFCNSCSNKDSLGEEFVFSGKVYRDCAKTFTHRNTPLEVVLKNQGLGGSKTKVLATTTTDENGHFSLKFKVNKREEVNLVIPANSSINLYSPIVVQEFNGLNTKVELKNMFEQDFYTSPLTDIKVKLKCDKTYTNQDTLYINPEKATDSGLKYMKIVAPTNNQIVVTYTKGGRDEVGVNWGIGWADFQKSLKSGADELPDYNLFWIPFPTCKNSPLEYVLEIK